MTPGELDADVRRDLRGLQKETAESVARHLVAAGMLVDEDPERALQHARYARRRAARIAVVRETAGIVAYHAGEWNEALGEFRAARRMGGGSGHVPVMADIERALGRPERALDMTRGPEARGLDQAERVELLIVAAGARRDLGELDAAVVGLQVPELDAARRDPWSARLFYAYADNLLAVGRRSEAVQWFVHAFDADTEGQTDAADRIADLTGEAPPGAEPDDAGFLLGYEDVAHDVAGDASGPGRVADVPANDAAGEPAVPDSGQRDPEADDVGDLADLADLEDSGDAGDAGDSADAVGSGAVTDSEDPVAPTDHTAADPTEPR